MNVQGKQNMQWHTTLVYEWKEKTSYLTSRRCLLEQGQQVSYSIIGHFLCVYPEVKSTILWLWLCSTEACTNKESCIHSPIDWRRIHSRTQGPTRYMTVKEREYLSVNVHVEISSSEPFQSQQLFSLFPHR